MKKATLATWAVGVCFQFGMVVAQAAPAEPAAPQHTVRTEIRRGGDAGDRCDADNRADVSAALICINDVEASNRQQMGQDFDFFNLGLYFSGWIHFHSLAGSADGARDTAVARRGEKNCWLSYVALRQKSGLSDSSVIESLKVGGPIKSMLAAAEQQFGH